VRRNDRFGDCLDRRSDLDFRLRSLCSRRAPAVSDTVQILRTARVPAPDLELAFARAFRFWRFAVGSFVEQYCTVQYSTVVYKKQVQVARVYSTGANAGFRHAVQQSYCAATGISA